MAYNRKNLLVKMIEVQEITYFQKHKIGLNLQEIYFKIIECRYFICYRTFHEYIGTPAKKQLKALVTEKEFEKLMKEIKERISEYLIKKPLNI
ncbi:hypothetical protein [Capnocytophaga sp.]|uniref:hypothetical protein n=1 Tax=Capnocytophaga sp. TaxID=44737 RepID=UPI0026DC4E96|nr:hypothetical protein [Capnocytophaga sp.]MDO5105807.1 hypothetical protein [Capnocytophaga sp.]